jgi:excisionase family DNA binding protein
MTLLTRREAACALRISKRTLERWGITGDGPKFVKAGRRVLYRQCDLDDWIASRLCLSTSQARAAT